MMKYAKGEKMWWTTLNDKFEGVDIGFDP